jgi:hypothetical protein
MLVAVEEQGFKVPLDSKVLLAQRVVRETKVFKVMPGRQDQLVTEGRKDSKD